MDHIRILRRSLEITWFYRALWVFGLILALTTARSGGSHGGGGGGGGGSSFAAPAGFASQSALRLFALNPMQIAGIVAAVVVVALLLAFIFNAARVVAETALIRMVNNYADSGERASVGQGFRLGWSRAALRLFLIDLLIFISLALVFLLLFALACAPLAGLLSDSNALKVIGTVSSASLLILVFVLLLLVIIGAAVLLPFIHRACVLEGQGVLDSLRRGWAIVRHRASDVLIMALVLFALSLAVTILVIPVIFVLLFGGAALGGLPALLAGLVSSLFLQGQLPWMIGLAVGLPIFLLVLIVPLLFLGSLAQVFTSSAWTLTYREIVTMQPAVTELPATD